MFTPTNENYRIRFSLHTVSSYKPITEPVQKQVTSPQPLQIGSNSQVLILEKKYETESQLSQIETSVGTRWNQNTWQIRYVIHTSPVYVDDSDGKERLIYNRKEMKVGKLYKITWLEQKFGLKKDVDGQVRLYELESD